jgi:predicted amidophosphoribosyltransferase
MATINPQTITGAWKGGIALDRHTLSSVHIGVNEFGHDVFETTRSELGDLLYRLKYNGDQKAADEIITTAAAYVQAHRAKFTMIVPVPPSTPRKLQPVITIAAGMGAAIGLPVVDCVTPTRATTQLKQVSDPDKRKELLDGLYVVDPALTKGQHILLFDDLYRSGATMNAITSVLLGLGQAASVNALTITRTRSNR